MNRWVPAWASRLGPFFSRMFVAHLAAYPIAFVWAVAGIVPALLTFAPAELAIHTDKEAANMVVRRLIWPAGACLLIVHALGLPWALATKRERLGLKVFWGGSGATLAIGIVVGGISWVWLLLK